MLYRQVEFAVYWLLFFIISPSATNYPNIDKYMKPLINVQCIYMIQKFFMFLFVDVNTVVYIQFLSLVLFSFAQIMLLFF